MTPSASNGFFLDAKGVLRCERLLCFSWLEHGFATRTSADWTNGFRVARLRQMHSDIVVTADLQDSEGLLGSDSREVDCGEGDAFATTFPNLLLTIRTADCVPVLLVDPETQSVAAVHAGWRGVVAGVLPRAVERMRESFQARPESLIAAIGPCIRQPSFEVGAEVARQFQSIFPERHDLDARTHVDLAEACRRQLVGVAISPNQVIDCGRCTYLEPELFHSYRRDRDAAGRMHAFIGVRAARA